MACPCPLPVTVDMLKNYVYAASFDLKTVVCVYDSRLPACDAFLSEFTTRLCASFAPYINKVQFFAINLAEDPLGLDGFGFTMPESGHIPAIWVVQGPCNLNDPRTALEVMAVGSARPYTGECFDRLHAEIRNYIWSQ